MTLKGILGRETWAKYTAMMSKHHCGQTFSTYLGGWAGHSPVRIGCPAAPRKRIWWFFVDLWKKFLVSKDRIFGNTEFLKIRPQRDRDDRYFEAVLSRGKEWCVVVPPKYCHGTVRSFWAQACSPWPCTQPIFFFLMGTLHKAVIEHDYNCAPSLPREHRQVFVNLFLVMSDSFFGAVSPFCTSALLLTVTPCFVLFLLPQLFVLFVCQCGTPSSRTSLTHCCHPWIRISTIIFTQRCSLQDKRDCFPSQCWGRLPATLTNRFFRLDWPYILCPSAPCCRAPRNVTRVKWRLLLLLLVKK